MIKRYIIRKAFDGYVVFDQLTGHIMSMFGELWQASRHADKLLKTARTRGGFDMVETEDGRILGRRSYEREKR